MSTNYEAIKLLAERITQELSGKLDNESINEELVFHDLKLIEYYCDNSKQDNLLQ